MEQSRHAPKVGKIKIMIGSLSLITVFATPYLHITQFSLSMNLLQSAIYSLVLFSFWIIAASLLRLKQPTPKTISFPKGNRQDHIHHRLVATV